MIYSKSYCPHCGNLVRKETNPDSKIGCPFEQCMHCRKMYRNSDKEEWITKSPIKRFFFFLQIYAWALAAFSASVISIAPSFLFDFENSTVTRIIWVTSFVVLLGLQYRLYKNASNEDIQKSLSRTNDPEYIEILKKAGYKIYPIKNNVTATSNSEETLTPPVVCKTVDASINNLSSTNHTDNCTPKK